jgi:hypothetical protein
LGTKPARRVDAGHRHVQPELGAGLGKQDPLVHGLEVVDRLTGLHLDQRERLAGRILGCEDEIGIGLPSARLDGHPTLVTDVHLDDEFFAEREFQRPDDPVVLELFAYRTDQNRHTASAAPQWVPACPAPAARRQTGNASMDM